MCTKEEKIKFHRHTDILVKSYPWMLSIPIYLVKMHHSNLKDLNKHRKVNFIFISCLSQTFTTFETSLKSSQNYGSKTTNNQFKIDFPLLICPLYQQCTASSCICIPLLAIICGQPRFRSTPSQ